MSLDIYYPCSSVARVVGRAASTASLGVSLGFTTQVAQALPISIQSSAGHHTQATLMKPQLDHLTTARHAGRSHIFLRFADGLEGTWSFRELHLDMSDMRLTTIKASASGTSVEVKSRRNEEVQLDASALRYAVDKKYAARIDKLIRDLHIPIEEARSATDGLPIDPRWADVDDDDLFE